MLGLGNSLTSIYSGTIYKELSELANSADLDIHFDFSTLTGAHGDAVAAATNLGAAGSGKNINAKNGTPTLDTVTMSRNSVSFDGTDDILKMAAAYTTTGKAFTFFIVFNKLDDTNDVAVANAFNAEEDYFIIKDSGNDIATRFNGETGVTIGMDSTTSSTINYSYTSTHNGVLVIQRVGSGAVEIYADNGLYVAKKSNAATKAGADFTLGAIGGTTSGSLADMGGTIGEVGIKPEKITDEQLKKVQDTVNSINRAQLEIGSMEIKKHEMMHNIAGLRDELTLLQGEFEKDYGTFDINIQDGKINYPENGETDKED